MVPAPLPSTWLPSDGDRVTVAIALSRVHYPVTTLGPGRRIVVWVQGCSIRCPGCVSMDTWAARLGDGTVEALMHGLEQVAGIADGLTVTGGEPFDQEEALLALLLTWRRKASGDVLVFSGYPYERLAPRLGAFTGLIDCLITDPFDAAAGQTRALRGSDNQRLICLTDRGHARFSQYERSLRESDRALDILFDDGTGEIFMAGIPRPGDLRRLAALLGEQGHRVVVTEDTRRAACSTT